MSEYYEHVKDCLEGARNQRFCAGAESGAAEIKRLRDLHLARTKLTKKMIDERDEARVALEQAQQLQRVTVDTVTQQDELLNMHSKRITELEAAAKAVIESIELDLGSGEETPTEESIKELALVLKTAEESTNV